MGKTGNLYFGTATEDDFGATASVIDALKTIPVVELKQAFQFEGSAVLRVDQSRRLK